MDPIEKNKHSKIVLPPSAMYETLDRIDYLLNNKNELMSMLIKNNQNFNKEQLAYLKALLNLEISVFSNEKINKSMIDSPLFFGIIKYNLYEGLLKLLKQINSVNSHQIVVRIGLPDQKWLNIRTYTNLFSFDLIEIKKDPECMKYLIQIYDNERYTIELANSLIKKTDPINMGSSEIDFHLKEINQIGTNSQLIVNEITNYWNLFPLEDNMIRGKKVKMLSFAKVYKINN